MNMIASDYFSLFALLEMKILYKTRSSLKLHRRQRVRLYTNLTTLAKNNSTFSACPTSLTTPRTCQPAP